MEASWPSVRSAMTGSSTHKGVIRGNVSKKDEFQLYH